MGTTILKLGATWDEVKAKIKEKNIDLTDDDLLYTKGKEDELIERVAKKLKRSKEDTKAYIESISENRGMAG